MPKILIIWIRRRLGFSFLSNFKFIRNKSRIKVSFLIKKLPTKGAKKTIGDNKNKFVTFPLAIFSDSLIKHIYEIMLKSQIK